GLRVRFRRPQQVLREPGDAGCARLEIYPFIPTAIVESGLRFPQQRPKRRFDPGKSLTRLPILVQAGQTAVQFRLWRSAMQCLRAFAALLALFLAGCGSTFHISGAVNPDIVTTTGTVSFVHVSVSSDGSGTMVNVTVVTLLQASMTQTLTF